MLFIKLKTALTILSQGVVFFSRSFRIILSCGYIRFLVLAEGYNLKKATEPLILMDLQGSGKPYLANVK